MVLNGADENSIAQYFSSGHQASGIGSEEFSLINQSKQLTIHQTNSAETADMFSKNEFVSEMASKQIRDFKGRSRTNIVPRIAKRIRIEEKRGKEKAQH